MLLLNLMSIHELEETIELLRKKLLETASSKGFSDERTITISQSLDLYLTRYNKLTCDKCKIS
jgi:hypothetical protein